MKIQKLGINLLPVKRKEMTRNQTPKKPTHKIQTKKMLKIKIPKTKQIVLMIQTNRTRKKITQTKNPKEIQIQIQMHHNRVIKAKISVMHLLNLRKKVKKVQRLLRINRGIKKRNWNKIRILGNQKKYQNEGPIAVVVDKVVLKINKIIDQRKKKFLLNWCHNRIPLCRKIHLIILCMRLNDKERKLLLLKLMVLLLILEKK
mmetsp:Transcript_64387/g.97050  ORF Transcript_64387/g.97050 Transcript_64387/m.97050 type:complete len:202 (-) Transcript_64387:115-720(-)